MGNRERKRIVFRCRFGGADGWGHVVRCSALADAFRDRDWETWLWGDGASEALPREVAGAFCGRYVEGEGDASLLVIDEMYTPQSELEALAARWRAAHPGSIVAGIDDMQARSMAGFDVAINTELGLRKAGYAARKALLGERYALLRKGFSQPNEAAVDLGLDSEAVPVFVMMGGTDAYGLVDTVLDGLAERRERIVPVVVTGERSVSSESLSSFCESRMLRNLGSADLAAWMGACRFGVIGCGSSVYEAAAMQLPFVGLSLVDNQMAAAGKIKELWNLPIVNCEQRRLEKVALCRAVDRVLASGQGAYSDVDTEGANRVADALVEWET